MPNCSLLCNSCFCEKGKIKSLSGSLKEGLAKSSDTTRLNLLDYQGKLHAVFMWFIVMSEIFKVKSAKVDALSLILHSADSAQLQAALDEYFTQNSDICTLPFLLDLHEMADAWVLRLDEMLPFFKEKGANIVGVRHSDESYAVMAQKHRLPFSLLPNRPQREPTSASTATAETTVSGSLKPCVLIDKPVRSGQQIYAENADLIVTSMVGEGAELIADGHIHVYGPLRGRALAGADGNRHARIFAQSMQAQLVSVAGVYRTFDKQLPPALHKKPVSVALQDERLLIQALVNESL